MPVLVGTSGWQYRHWAGVLYPAGLPQSRWLAHYAARFRAVEVNATFYRLPQPATVERWCASTPEDFVLAIKASRYLTHVRRLRDPEGPVERLLGAVGRLGDKLGPVLVQLPPDMPLDASRLEELLAAVRGRVRIAVEFRHLSWFTDATRQLLERYDAALCMADRGSRPVSPLWRTATWGYLRMHEGRARPRPRYGPTALDAWARRLAAQYGQADEVFVFFNNDAGGWAVRDAVRFAARARAAGLAPTRVPRDLAATAAMAGADGPSASRG